VTPVNRTTSVFDRKWTSYALAGGAMLVAPAVANAGVIFTDLTGQNVSLFVEEGEGSVFANLDVNNDGIDDYEFAAFDGGTGARATAVNALDGNLIFADAPFAHAFGNAELVGGTTDTFGFFKKDFKGTPIGQWPNDINQTRFLGIQFTVDTNTYNGWVAVSQELGSATVNVTQAAWEDTGGSITTPDAAEVPEPSSMALMLLGAAGVAALKRRRRA